MADSKDYSDTASRESETSSIEFVEVCREIGGIDNSNVIEDDMPNEPVSPPYKSTETIRHTSNNHKATSPGIVYLSRIPPYMRVNKVRHLLSQFGEVGKIYLQPENSMVRRRRIRQGGKKKRKFVEGWVELKDKNIAKRIADSLNNTQIGGKKRNFHYFDLWNVKYLHGFKWFHLTESIAFQTAVREQRLRTEMSQVKRENNFYLQNVEKGKEITAIEERKTRQDKQLVVRTGTEYSQREVLIGNDMDSEEMMSASFLAKILPNSVS